MSDHFQDHGPFVEVKTKLFLIIWGLLATIGTFLVSLFLFYQGLKFESSYALIYLAVSIIGMPFGLITFLWGIPGFFSKRKAILLIKQGETLSSAVKKNKTVLIQDIKEVRLDRHFYSFRGLIYEDLIITAKKGKRIRIPTYNLLGPVVFDQMVRSYILPYMDESDREVWLKNNKGFHFAESNQAPD